MHGSKRICRYPCLIAAYHVLLRLLAPRHPSCALCSLINRILTTLAGRGNFVITEILLAPLTRNRISDSILQSCYYFLYVDVKEPARPQMGRRLVWIREF